MPLPPPVARQKLHERRIEMHGYARADGWFDIEGHLVDTKPHPFQVTAGPRVEAGQSIHEMWIRLTIDQDHVVRDVAAATDAAPYGDCRDTPDTLRALIGTRVAAGWSAEIRKRLGGALSCTHLREMLVPMSTVAFQALLVPLRERGLLSTGAAKVDGCYAFAAHRSVAALRWPAQGSAPAPAKTAIDPVRAAAAGPPGDSDDPR
jgi:hypothetical protein